MGISYHAPRVRYRHRSGGDRILAGPRTAACSHSRLPGEYGEGALRIGGKTVEYYSTAAASIGFQAGAQSKSIIMVFLNQKLLSEFRKSEGWEAGVDGSIALIEWGAGEDINTIDIREPVVGFVLSNKGLMFNVTFEGTKFTKIKR